MNIHCVGGWIMGPAVAWDVVGTFLAAGYRQVEQYLRRPVKVASLDQVAAAAKELLERT